MDDFEDYDERNNILADEDDGDDDGVEEAHGFYNVTSSFQYDPSEITEPVEFVCELTIPNTSFNKRSSKLITPGI